MNDTARTAQQLCAAAMFLAAAGLVICSYGWIRLSGIVEKVRDAAPTHHAALAARVVPQDHPAGETAKDFLNDHFEVDIKSHEAWVASANGWRDSMLLLAGLFALSFVSTFGALLNIRRSNKALQTDGSRPAGETRR